MLTLMSDTGYFPVGMREFETTAKSLFDTRKTLFLEEIATKPLKSDLEGHL